MQIADYEQLDVSRDTSDPSLSNTTHHRAKQLADDALDQLAAALDQGKSEALLNYLSVMARFSRYSRNNLLLIAMQRPSASHVAGFDTWRKLGRFVRKGSKGIAILAPMVYRNKKADRVDTDDEQARIFGFRTAYVFDVADTDGQDLPDLPAVSGDPQHYTERPIAFIHSNGITLDYSVAIAPAKGISKGGAIVILPDLSPAEKFSVLVHECSHELLHRGERRAATDKTVRETEAEAVAFVVCHARPRRRNRSFGLHKSVERR